MLFEKNQKIVFVGDSITDADHNSINAPWGLGYVNQVRDLLLARYPDLGLQFVNAGLGGNTTRHLLARWNRDVLAQRPDWVALKIGINDVWRSFDRRPASDAVPLAEYNANLRKLIEQTRDSAGIRMILLTPYMIETSRNEPMRAAMDDYGAVVKGLGQEYSLPVVDTQAAFDAALAHTKAKDWADDRIHPNGAGHAIIALAFLRSVGSEF